MKTPAIKVTIEIDDGCGEPFGGSAFYNHGVLLKDALYCCRMALASVSYGCDELIAVVNGKQVLED